MNFELERFGTINGIKTTEYKARKTDDAIDSLAYAMAFDRYRKTSFRHKYPNVYAARWYGFWMAVVLVAMVLRIYFQ